MKKKDSKAATSPLITASQSDDDNASSTPGNLATRKQSWRVSVYAGALIAALILGANIGVVAWVEHGFSTTGGIATLFDGSCDVSKKAAIYADLAVNILSTVLLSASNNCAQLISAPTRQEVDSAHATGDYLDIGVPSIRNLRRIPAWRVRLWCLLFLSSIPLHLLYNSVVFVTYSAVDYQAALVTEDFLHGGYWNRTRIQAVEGPQYPPNMGQLQDMYENVDQLERLDNAECIRAYGTSMTETNWRNVLLVTALPLNDSMIQVYEHWPDAKFQDISWICNGNAYRGEHYDLTCDISKLIKQADVWTLSNVSRCDLSYNGWVDTPCQQITALIEYCLAEPFEPHCTVRISTAILYVVIICNAMKTCVLFYTAWRKSDPLATVGDAIASFLEHPDPTTQGKGALSAADVWSKDWKQQFKDGKMIAKKPLDTRTYRWAGAVSQSRWFFCVFLCLVAWCTALGLYVQAKGNSVGNDSFAAAFAEGLGSISASNLVTASLHASLTSNILLANLPQIVVSFVYLLYNNVLTCMLATSEYASFAPTRKPLRVTHRRGQQRSTYWLQLPYRYVLPLMCAMAILHWMISRSIFLVQIDIFDNNGKLMTARRINACGYSVPPLLLAFILGSVLILALILLSCRPLAAGIPVAGSCSIAISAACHANETDAALQPLRYGIVPNAPADQAGSQYVGFSCHEVRPLQDQVKTHLVR